MQGAMAKETGVGERVEGGKEEEIKGGGSNKM